MGLLETIKLLGESRPEVWCGPSDPPVSPDHFPNSSVVTFAADSCFDGTVCVRRERDQRSISRWPPLTQMCALPD
jgi:hypothetical protein